MDPGTCPGSHVQAAPPGLQDRRGPQLLVASHQRHPPGLPPVCDPGECPHHDLVVGGGLPAPTGVCADGRPSPRPGRGDGGRPEGGGPTTPQGRGSRLRRTVVVGLCGRHLGGGPWGGVPAGEGPHNGGVATGHGPGCACGQVVLLGARGVGRPTDPAPGCPNPASGHFPPTRCGRRALHPRVAAVWIARPTGPVLGGRLPDSQMAWVKTWVTPGRRASRANQSRRSYRVCITGEKR